MFFICLPHWSGMVSWTLIEKGQKVLNLIRYLVKVKIKKSSGNYTQLYKTLESGIRSKISDVNWRSVKFKYLQNKKRQKRYCKKHQNNECLLFPGMYYVYNNFSFGYLNFSASLALFSQYVSCRFLCYPAWPNCIMNW